MHAIGLLVVRAALPQLEPARQLGVDRVRKAFDLGRVELTGQRVRTQLSVVQDLVCPRATDAREHTLVAEQRVQTSGFFRTDLAEPFGADPKRLGAEVCELDLCLLGRQEPDTRPLLRSASVSTSWEPPWKA